MFHHSSYVELIDNIFSEYMRTYQENRLILKMFGDVSDEKLNEYDLEIRRIDITRVYINNLVSASIENKTDAYLKYQTDLQILNDDILNSQASQLRDTNS